MYEISNVIPIFVRDPLSMCPAISDVMKNWLSIISRKRRSFGDGSVTWTSNGQWETIVPEGVAYHSSRERTASQDPSSTKYDASPGGKANSRVLLLYYVAVNLV